MNPLPRLHGAMDWAARRRAERIARRIAPFLPESGPVLDLGSGAGHNGAALRSLTGQRFVEADLGNLSRVGPGPVLYDGRRLPFRNRSFSACTLIFVLQYVADVASLFAELQRVVAGPILVMQSTVALPRRKGWLRLSDDLLGPIGCRTAAAIGYLGQSGRRPRWSVERSFDLPSIEAWFVQFGLSATLLSPGPWPIGPVRHDLFRIEA